MHCGHRHYCHSYREIVLLLRQMLLNQLHLCWYNLYTFRHISIIFYMSIVLQAVILLFFCKIQDGLIVFQKLATSVILKNISALHISGCWKAYL